MGRTRYRLRGSDWRSTRAKSDERHSLGEELIAVEESKTGNGKARESETRKKQAESDLMSANRAVGCA